MPFSLPHPAILLQPEADTSRVRPCEDVILHVSFSILLHETICSELHLRKVQPSVVGKVFIKF